MNQEFYSSHLMKVDNPLIGFGVIRILSGVAMLIFAAWYLKDFAPVLQAISDGRFRYDPVVLGGNLALAVLAAIWASIGLYQAVRGFTHLGMIIVPPRAPADFKDYDANVATPLERGEMPVYAVPKSGPWRQAYRLFPARFLLMTASLRELVSAMLRSASNILCLLILITFTAVLLPFLPDVHQLVGDNPDILSFPLFPAAVLSVISVSLFMLLFALFPKHQPRAEVIRLHKQILGGGDPTLIPHNLEQRLRLIQPRNDTPNRVCRLGFEMQPGGVGDTGKFTGKLIVENQPAPYPAEKHWAVQALLAVAFVTLLTGLFLTTTLPDYLQDLSPQRMSTYIVALRWVARRVLGVILVAMALNLFRHVREYLETYRFKSLVSVLSVDGNYGRSQISVGKSIHDSIESQNVIIRSDSACNVFLAVVLSESMGLTGNRQIVSMIANDEARNLQKLIGEWLEEFENRGAAIAGVDLSRQSIGQVARANMEITAQRARVSTSEATGYPELDVPKPPPSLPAPTPEPAQPQPGTTVPAGLAEDTKVCPDCAEAVKQAARKCRFCGYIFTES